MTTIESAAIVGAGQMGRGIAEVCTTSGIETWLCDVSQAALDDAVNIIETNLIKQVERGRMSNEALASALSRIRCSTRLEDLSEVDLAIEAATEKRSIKEDIFVQLDKTLN